AIASVATLTPPARVTASPTPHARAVSLLAAVTAVLIGVEIALLVDGPVEPAWLVVLFPMLAGVYLAAGVIAALRRPNNAMGSLLVAGALAWLLAAMVNLEPTALIVVGMVCATLPLAVVVHLLHAFPSGRLRGSASRAMVAFGYVVALVLQAPLYLFGQGSLAPYDALQLADRPDLAEAGRWVQDGFGVILILATAVLLAQRMRDAQPAQRRVLGPLFAYGIFAVVFVVASAQLADHVLAGYQEERVVAQLALLAGVPLAFAATVLRGGFARMGEVDELGAWLGAETGGRPTLARALAHALGDPSLRLALWVPDAGGFVDFEGHPVTLPAQAAGRGIEEVRRGERLIGAIDYDAMIIGDHALVEAAGRMTAIALDHERLTVELLASREALRRSRQRILDAADGERRRVARDLHDGLQGQLVVLAIAADRLASDAAVPPAAQTTAVGLRIGLERVVDELRALVQGVMPAALIERGLPAATEDLADRMPLPTALRIDGDLGYPAGKLPAAVELAGYFVVAEALANTVKHARASEVSIVMERPDGHLRIEIRDDGVGGAVAGSGTGMRGMADRVDVLGGRLTVTSPAGGGTSVLAEVPCAS
ncbi:MAG TPA: ATP-binding protein, partial [Capillimicrobium sp.]